MWTERHAAALRAVIDTLNASGIEWMVLRNHEGLPERNRSKDIDLAMAKADFDRCEQLLSAVLGSQGFNRLVVERFQYVRCLTYLCFTAGDVVSIKIDLLDGFVWRGAQLFDFADLYATRERYRDLSIPSRLDDGLMLWMKPLLTGGFVEAAHVDDILFAANATPDAFRARLVRLFGEDRGLPAWKAIDSGQLQDTVPMARTLAWAAWRRAWLRHPWATAAASISHVVHEVRRRASRPRGSFVSVAGPDGVGKTTFIELLREQMREATVKDAAALRVVHFRPGILPNLKAVLSGRAYDATREEFHRPHRAQPASAPSSLVRLTYYWLDYVLGYFLQTRPACAKGAVVIYDRYFYDFVVDPRRSRLGLPLWVRALYLRFTPQPDLVFFLDCDAHIVYARKQELPEEEIVRQLQEYRRLTQADPDRFVALNARRPAADSASAAVNVWAERCLPALQRRQL